MVDYISLATLVLHRNLLDYLGQQRRRMWREIRVRPAGARRVGVMGLGVLGTAVLDFRGAGWSRTPHAIAGVDTYHGSAEFGRFLAAIDILICLLPLTSQTRGILGARTFDMLPRGAAVVNVGRGGHLVEADLLAALDSGQLSAAVVDVLEQEPAP